MYGFPASPGPGPRPGLSEAQPQPQPHPSYSLSQCPFPCLLSVCPSVCPFGVVRQTVAGSACSASRTAAWARSRVSRRTRITQPTGTPTENSHHWMAYA